MSFYVGKNPSSLCHITKGTQDISTMRGGIIPDTIIHSDAKYITYISYSLTSSESLTVVSSITGLPLDVTVYSIDSILLNNILNKNAFIAYDSSGNYISIQWVDKNKTTIYNPNDISSFPSGTQITPIVKPEWITETSSWSTPPSTIYIKLLNIKYDGTISLPPDDGEILINNSNLKVNGIDFTTFKYINLGVINTYDPTVNIKYSGGNTTLQFINENPSGTGISISVDNNRTILKRGNVNVIDSSVGNQGMVVYKSNHINIPGNSFLTTYTYTLLTSISSTDIFIVTIRLGVSGDYNYGAFHTITGGDSTENHIIFYNLLAGPGSTANLRAALFLENSSLKIKFYAEGTNMNNFVPSLTSYTDSEAHAIAIRKTT